MRLLVLLTLAATCLAGSVTQAVDRRDLDGFTMLPMHRRDGGSPNPSYPCKTVKDCAGQGGHKCPISDEPTDSPSQSWFDKNGVAVCRADGQCDCKPPPGANLVESCKQIYNDGYGWKALFFAACMADETTLACEGTCPCDGSCCTREAKYQGPDTCVTHANAALPAPWSCPGIKEPCPADSAKFKLAKSDPNGLSGSPASSPSNGSSPDPNNNSTKPSPGPNQPPSNGSPPGPHKGHKGNKGNKNKPKKGTPPGPSPPN